MRAPSWFGWGLALLLATLVACTSPPEQTPAAEEPADSRAAAPAAPAGAAPAATAEPASAGSGGTSSVATAAPGPTGSGGTASLATAEPGPTESAGAAPAATAPVAAPAPDLGFPTGPAVLVAASYEPPTARVDSTGAFLPANGKPTLVFVDAIW